MPTPSRDERGLNESLQWALVLPLVLLVVLGVLQTALWLHARQAAQDAAAAAAEAEAVLHPPPEAGEHAALEITRIAGLRDVDVHVDRGAELITVTVTGRPQLILDLGPGSVREQAVISPERVTRP
ncbi:TadE/TadG family type IV pilus assembly protein [Enemella sp. A6]|uniref:TadE/TadG family type IV pilus assembly protein n=1 Tax=Enemella sp. A6 TaxID=3440152 RepID=UPI003EBC9FE3